MKTHRIVITPGEPAGVGPDLIIQIAQNNWPVELVACADPYLLKERAILLDLPLKVLSYTPNNQPIAQRAGTITVLPFQLYTPVIVGQVNTKNSYYVIDTLTRACDGCQCNEFSALVTGPVHKGIINDAGIPFTGHTEFLKERTQSQVVVMMLVTEKLRIALVTTHLPIRKVSASINTNLLRNVIRIIHYDLCNKFNIQSPNILVCRLNPHAGEGGYIGREEIDIIIPAIEEMKKQGIRLSGPLPADTIFQPKYLDNSDIILTMYHDQGLPVLKYQGFNYGVNVTLGLPFIRTSVDHGTVLHLAGQGKANANSLIMALNLAIKMINNS